MGLTLFCGTWRSGGFCALYLAYSNYFRNLQGHTDRVDYQYYYVDLHYFQEKGRIAVFPLYLAPGAKSNFKAGAIFRSIIIKILNFVCVFS